LITGLAALTAGLLPVPSPVGVLLVPVLVLPVLLGLATGLGDGEGPCTSSGGSSMSRLLLLTAHCVLMTDKPPWPPVLMLEANGSEEAGLGEGAGEEEVVLGCEEATPSGEGLVGEEEGAGEGEGRGLEGM
jgi:hypothetical protein